MGSTAGGVFPRILDLAVEPSHENSKHTLEFVGDGNRLKPFFPVFENRIGLHTANHVVVRKLGEFLENVIFSKFWLTAGIFCSSVFYPVQKTMICGSQFSVVVGFLMAELGGFTKL